MTILPPSHFFRPVTLPSRCAYDLRSMLNITYSESSIGHYLSAGIATLTWKHIYGKKPRIDIIK